MAMAKPTAAVEPVVALAAAASLRLSRSMRSLAAVGLVVALAAAACSYETKDFTFEVDPLFDTAQSSRVYDRNGTLIVELRGEQNRTDVTDIDLIPELVRNAVIAIEDERFYEHDGVDLKAILRATRSNVSSGGVAEGASTITQQYVGNIFLDRSEVTASRKLTEIFMARRFEKQFTKDFILLRYLNWVYFGNGAYGIEAAAREYFGAPDCGGARAGRPGRDCLKVSELAVEQAALLAGLIQRPSAFDPYRNPVGARKRRNLVLDRMLVNEMITEAEHAEATDEPLVLVEDVPLLEERYPAAYFVEDVKQWFLGNPDFGATREARARLLFEGGLEIRTTIDLELQAAAEAAVEAILPDNGVNPDASAVTLGVGGDADGHVLAMVGGRDFFGPGPEAKFNLASDKGRQAGSAMKPVALATALSAGFSVTETYDAPNELEIDRTEVCGPVWKIRGGRGSTPEEPVRVSLVQATRQSVNTVYAQLMIDVRPSNFVRMAEELGIGKDRIAPVCAAVLGTEDVNMVELATVYATFARSGLRVDPVTVTSIRNSDGTSLYEHRSDPQRALDRRVADQIAWVLEGAVASGTGHRAQFGRPAAGKTGTAQNFADAAFAGFTPQRATAVWVGFPVAQIPMVPPTTDIRVFGGTYPAMIWREIMTAAHADIAASDFPTPPPSPPPTTEPPQPDTVEVPDLIGRQWDPGLLTAELAELAFGVSAVEVPSQVFPAGTVMGQAPIGGSLRPEGTVITVEVAFTPEAPDVVEVPTVVDLTEAEARQVLTGEGLGVETVVQVIGDTGVEIGPGAVWRQEPLPGTALAPGQLVTLWVTPDPAPPPADDP